jgi:hypothetical protein
MNTTPSYPEFDGLYNICDQDVPTEYRGIQVLRTREMIPILTWRELERIRKALRMFLVREARISQLTKSEHQFLYRDAVSDRLLDRTIAVELPSMEPVNFGFLKKLQQDVLRKFPLWRVLLAGVDRESSIVVYPDAIRPGIFRPNDTLQSAIKELVATVRAHEMRFEGPQRRQLEYIQKSFRRKEGMPGRGGFKIVGIFDNYQGDSDRVSIWIVHDGVHSQAVRIVEPRRIAVGDVHKVSDRGRIGLAHDTDNDLPFYLTQTVMERRELPTEIAVKDERHRKLHRITIDVGRILEDKKIMP